MRKTSGARLTGDLTRLCGEAERTEKTTRRGYATVRTSARSCLSGMAADVRRRAVAVSPWQEQSGRTSCLSRYARHDRSGSRLDPDERWLFREETCLPSMDLGARPQAAEPVSLPARAEQVRISAGRRVKREPDRPDKPRLRVDVAGEADARQKPHASWGPSPGGALEGARVLRG